MYAVIEVGGKQYRVSEGETIEVERLPLAVGESLDIHRVLLLGGDGQLVVGRPTVEGAQVRALVTDQGRGRKVTVFKFKRGNRYQRKQGHRQGYTRLKIESIITAKAPEKPVMEKRVKKVQTPLEEVGLSPRTERLLKGAKITTVEKLVARLKEGDEALLQISGFGPRSLEEVRSLLVEKGFLEG